MTRYTDESKMENLDNISGQNSMASQIGSVHNVSVHAQNFTRKELDLKVQVRKIRVYVDWLKGTSLFYT